MTFAEHAPWLADLYGPGVKAEAIAQKLTLESIRDLWAWHAARAGYDHEDSEAAGWRQARAVDVELGTRLTVGNPTLNCGGTGRNP